MKVNVAFTCLKQLVSFKWQMHNHYCSETLWWDSFPQQKYCVGAVIVLLASEAQGMPPHPLQNVVLKGSVEVEGIISCQGKYGRTVQIAFSE